MTRVRLGALSAEVSPRAGDVLLALALTAAAQIEFWVTPEISGPIVFVTSTLMTAAIAVRRLIPLGTVIVEGAALVAQTLFLDAAAAPFAQFVAFFAATYSVAACSTLRPALLGGGVALVATWIATAREHGSGVDDYMVATLLVGASWLAGRALGERRMRVAVLEQRALELEDERAREAAAAVADERARIARELHDVISHSISVISIQTEAVRRRLGPDQDREIADLRLIESTARQAMAEMRRLFGVLRADRSPLLLAPQPGLDQLDRLLEQTRAAGVPVELRVEGEAVPVPPGVDLMAYRVVQEALTNVLKHAGPANSTVTLRYSDVQLELQVEDSGTGNVSRGAGGGHGLVGMQERVDLYGGTFQAGDRPGGGFLVRARLPLRKDVG